MTPPPSPDQSRDTDEALPEPTKSPVARWIILVTAAAFVGVVVARLATHDQPADPPTRTSPPPASSTTNIPAPPATPRTYGSYPDAPIRAATAMLCRNRPHCTVHSHDRRLRDAATAALGPTAHIALRTIDNGRALIVAATDHHHRQLFVTATTAGVVVRPARLGIEPPIGVQTQDNGTTRLTVVVSGSPDSIRWLSRPHVKPGSRP